MKHIRELTNTKNINLIVFDVDGVIVPRGTEIIERDSSVTYNLKFPPSEFIELAQELLNYSHVAISSGRNMLTLKTIFTELFGESKNGNHFILQAENGGRISMGPEEINAGHNHDCIRSLSDLRSRLRKIKHEHIKGFEPKETILTVHCHDRVPEIEKMPDKNTYIIWNGESYDFGDPSISKGTSLEKLKEILEKRFLKKITSIAIGDRENDLALLKKADISVSADPKVITETHYFIPDDLDQLPGIILARHLLEKFKNPD